MVLEIATLIADNLPFNDFFHLEWNTRALLNLASLCSSAWKASTLR